MVKKTEVILIILALIAGGCGQTTKNQTETAIEDTLTIVEDTELVEVQNTNNNSLFDIKKIDSKTYFALKEKATIPTTSLEVITDFEQAKKMLKGRVIWGKYDEEWKFVEDENGEEDEELVYKIVFRNGKIYPIEYREAFFIAYYPQEDILLLEGGHASDISFNLTTGEETEDVGNPEYIIFSPSKQYRLNGHFGGQECSDYFIQKKINGHYQKFFQMTSLHGRGNSELEEKIGIWLCYITDAFWQSDTVLNFITVVPDETGREEIELYYQLILQQTIDSSSLCSNEIPKLEIHTDTFEYVDYNGDYDYSYFILKRNGKDEYLYDGIFEEAIPDLSNGDLIEVQWQLDSTWVAGDNESFGGLRPFAKKIKKIGCT